VYSNQKRACFAYVHFVDTGPTTAATNIPTTAANIQTTATVMSAPGTIDD